MVKRRNYRATLLCLILQIVAFCNSAPLSTSSRWIIDSSTGKRVKLTCVNWVSHLEPMIAEGLEKQPLNVIVKKIAAAGFNCVRFTWPTYMFTRKDYRTITVSQSLDKFKLTSAKAGIAKNNPQFLNMSVVSLHTTLANELGKNNLMVVLDNHVSQPRWCCGADDGNGFFGDKDFNPAEWLLGLAEVARRSKPNPAVIGISMRNELRGSHQNTADWYKYIQQGADTIHRENPNLLIIASGLSYDTDLGFLKSKQLPSNLNNKLVYEAHWYSFGLSADQWAAQTNQLCAQVTKKARDNYLFLTTGKNSFPLFLSEFGVDNTGNNEADNRYIDCLLAAVAEADIDWALWALQGSYMLREGTVNHDETYGILDINWDRFTNQAFLNRLELIKRINQDFRSRHPTYYVMFHSQSGLCVRVINKYLHLVSCRNASHWDRHQDNGPIKLAGSPQCLAVAKDGAIVSNNCSTKWKYVSSSGLHLATQVGNGKSLCLERDGPNFVVVTKKCLCVGDNLADLPKCSDKPQIQWFKFVPANV